MNEKEAEDAGINEIEFEENSENDEEGVCKEEGIHMKFLKSPKLPTQREVDEHNVSHFPFRDWCPICVKAKARNTPHVRQSDREHQVPHIHVDYGFFGSADDDENMILQVARDEESRALFRSCCPA